MAQLKVHVVSIDKERFPGFVGFKLVDVFGDTHMFIEKLSVIGIEIQETPYFAWIDCTVRREKPNSVLVTTKEPHCIESSNGNTEFEIAKTSFR